MIIPSGTVRVLVATRPVDFRKGMDGLCALVQEALRSDPYSGVIYVFRSKRADRVPGLLAGQLGIAAVEHRLPAAGLSFGEINRMTQASQNAHQGLTGLRTDHVAEARDHEGELHGANRQSTLP